MQSYYTRRVEGIVGGGLEIIFIHFRTFAQWSKHSVNKQDQIPFREQQNQNETKARFMTLIKYRLHPLPPDERRWQTPQSLGMEMTSLLPVLPAQGLGEGTLPWKPVVGRARFQK